MLWLRSSGERRRKDHGDLLLHVDRCKFGKPLGMMLGTPGLPCPWGPCPLHHPGWVCDLDVQHDVLGSATPGAPARVLKDGNCSGFEHRVHVFLSTAVQWHGTTWRRAFISEVSSEASIYEAKSETVCYFTKKQSKDTMYQDIEPSGQERSFPLL